MKTNSRTGRFSLENSLPRVGRILPSLSRGGRREGGREEGKKEIEGGREGKKEGWERGREGRSMGDEEE